MKCTVLAGKFGAHFGELADEVFRHKAAHQRVGAHAGQGHHAEQLHFPGKERGTNLPEIRTTVGNGGIGLALGIQRVGGEVGKINLAGELFFRSVHEGLEHFLDGGMAFQIPAEEGQTHRLPGSGVGGQRRAGKRKQDSQSERSRADTPFFQHDNTPFQLGDGRQQRRLTAPKNFSKGFCLLSQLKEQGIDALTGVERKKRIFLTRMTLPQ